MARRDRTAVLGGTFDRLHAGHHALLAAGFRVAERVGIGLTTDSYLTAHPKPLSEGIRPFEVRRRALLRYLRSHFRGRAYWVVPLEDPFGGSVEPGVDILVVSEETLRGARRVNQERRRRGLPPVRIIAVPIQRATDLRPIAGRRIRAGEIDRLGHRRTVPRIGIQGAESYLGALQAAIRRELGGAPIEWVARPELPRTAQQTLSEAAEAGARRALRGAEYGLCLATGTGPSVPAALAGWDVEGPVGIARGSVRPPAGVDRLVHRLFERRRAALPEVAARPGPAARSRGE